MTTVSTPRKIATTATAGAALGKGFHTPVDATAGALTMTLPTTAAAGVEVSVEKVDASTNAVTISGTLRGAASSTITLDNQYDGRTFLSEGGGSWRPTSDHRTATSLASKFISALIVIADTTGTTDASAAIQAKINLAAAAGGGVVYLPAGQYRLNTSLLPKPGVSLIGAGQYRSTLLPYGLVAAIAAPSQYSVLAPLEECVFSDFGIDGANQAGTYSASIKGIYAKYLRRCTFRSLYIRNTGASGLGIDYLVDVLIERVTANGCGRLNDGTGAGGAGIGIGTGEFPIENWVAAHCVTNNNGTHGIFTETQNGGLSVGMKIIGHYAESNARYGIADAGSNGLQVTGGTCRLNGFGGLGLYQGTISPAFPGQFGLIDGLDCDQNAHGVHINWTGRTGSWLRYQFKNLRLRGSSGHGMFIEIGATNLSQLTVDNCEMHSNQKAGVCTTSTGGVLIDGNFDNNRVYNNGQNTGAPERQGIRLGANTTRLHLHNNKCWDSAATGSKLQTYGIQFNGGSTHTDASVDGNDVRGNQTGGLQASGTFTTSVIGDNPGYNIGITGTPEGVVTAPVGTRATRADGAAGTTFYVKETGVGSTGWVAK